MKLVYGVRILILIIVLAFSHIRAQGADGAMEQSGQAGAQFGVGAGADGGDGVDKAQGAASAGMNMGSGLSGAFGGPTLPSNR
ncbi:hypothetical protein GQX74_003245 [Glossina fuscipes]|nr:hypothetical protein GQX74_003245 [Glossina fuscipes]